MAPARRELSLGSRRPTTTFVSDGALAKRACLANDNSDGRVVALTFAEARPASALKCRDISVRYGDVAALTGVSVEFAPKLIHAVVGQNGAGKTTFARVVSGLVRPDTGAIEIDDRQVAPGHVNRSRAAGVELVHQSFALPPSFTVAEAMEFGARRGRPIFSRRALEARWKQHLENLDVRARMGDRIRDLPVESQQGVEIARALVADAKLLILDEPTAVLSPSGVETLFRRLRGLKASGVTILLVLHKIREVLAVADTVTVLRGGKLVQGPTAASAVEPHELSAAIIGAEAEKALTPSDEEALVGSELLAERGRPRRGRPPRHWFSRWIGFQPGRILRAQLFPRRV